MCAVKLFTVHIEDHVSNFSGEKKKEKEKKQRKASGGVTLKQSSCMLCPKQCPCCCLLLHTSTLTYEAVKCLDKLSMRVKINWKINTALWATPGPFEVRSWW